LLPVGSAKYNNVEAPPVDEVKKEVKEEVKEEVKVEH
jgi:hypothetical protein